MGLNLSSSHSRRRLSFDANGEVNFDHFQILRAIGKGSFGKVCIAKKKDTGRMYAMKYMNKQMCAHKDAARNVFSEVALLRELDHPFLVNLWFTFQDEEDLFIVVDLLLGGDLRYHMNDEMRFDERRVKLYLCELALALDYLRQQRVVHRDLKPDNILLDEEGHVHVTDFNIATRLTEGRLITSMSGTKPYMAPEVFACALNECAGYSYPVDWWSLAVSIYEMLRGRRPYDIHSGLSPSEIKQHIYTCPVHYSSSWDNALKNLLRKMLSVDPATRLSSLAELKTQPYVSDVDFDLVLKRQIKPPFIPQKDHLNCDPSYELEEMIIESKPLHKKKQRLAKSNYKREKCQRNSLNNDKLQPNEPCTDPIQLSLEQMTRDFQPYNRERYLLESQQQQQQQQLQQHSVEQSQPTVLQPDVTPEQKAAEAT